MKLLHGDKSLFAESLLVKKSEHIIGNIVLSPAALVAPVVRLADGTGTRVPFR